MPSYTFRPIRIEGDVAYVPLTKGYEAVIDAADLPLVRSGRWMAVEKNKVVYAARRMAGNVVRMHRVIMGAQPGVIVDHKDCDGLNNRRSNLRIATPSQSQQNRRISVTNKSGFRGVYPHRDKWAASIQADGGKTYLGTFKCPTAAHFAYAKASAELHGEFGRLA